MPVKIIHTADVHLDAAFKGLGAEKGRLKRRAIRDTLRSIIDDCLEWPADVLLIAGDLYEEQRVSPDSIGFVKTQFARLGRIPVIITPGNHDPFTASSPYAAPDWPANVGLFREGRAAALELPELGITVTGFAHTSPHMPGRLIEAVGPAAEGGGVQVLVAHASREFGAADKSADDIWLPFSEDEIASLGYAYTALGHYHAPWTFERGRSRGCYPGCPEGLRFSETGRRQYVRVTVDAGAVEMERIPVSRLEYEQVEISCEDFESREQFFEAILKSALKQTGRMLARFTATGRTARGFSLAAEPPEDIANRFFHLEVRDRTTPDYEWGEIEREDTLRGEVARLLAARLEKAEDAERPLLEKARLLALEALDGRQIDLPPGVLRVD